MVVKETLTILRFKAITMMRAMRGNSNALRVKCEGARYADPWINLQAKVRIKSFNLRV